MVSAKVKATGEFFIATTDFGTDQAGYRDAHAPLEVNHIYGGHLFPESSVGTTQYVEFTHSVSATFRGSELDEEIGDIRLVPFR